MLSVFEEHPNLSTEIHPAAFMVLEVNQIADGLGFWNGSFGAKDGVITFSLVDSGFPVMGFLPSGNPVFSVLGIRAKDLLCDTVIPKSEFV